MKFEAKYPDATTQSRHEFEYSYVTKTAKLGQCRFCGSFTKWMDVMFQHHACGEECLASMWASFRADDKGAWLEGHLSAVRAELQAAEEADDPTKDIIVVVRDQPEYLRECVETVRANTKNYNLFVWDNASGEETRRLVERLAEEPNVTTVRSGTNRGFIEPNNELAGWGDGEYIVLLNSDTKVFDMWDRAMTAFLKANPDVAQVGYWGGHMGPDGRGFGGANGYDIDYIPGWCFCLSRKTYEEFGLFDAENLRFAYCEDADLSLRLKEAGKKVYALHAPLVHHYQNKTVVQVEREGEIDLAATFATNHEYLRRRWADYLANGRVVAKKRTV